MLCRSWEASFEFRLERSMASSWLAVYGSEEVKAVANACLAKHRKEGMSDLHIIRYIQSVLKARAEAKNTPAPVGAINI